MTTTYRARNEGDNARKYRYKTFHLSMVQSLGLSGALARKYDAFGVHARIITTYYTLYSVIEEGKPELKQLTPGRPAVKKSVNNPSAGRRNIIIAESRYREPQCSSSSLMSWSREGNS